MVYRRKLGLLYYKIMDYDFWFLLRILNAKLSSETSLKNSFES